MDIKFSTQEYEIIKDGVIIAEEHDRISFKFSDLTFKLEIRTAPDEDNCWNQAIVSEDKKTITLPIKIKWKYLSTTFTDRIMLATYEEKNVRKGLYLTYAINGLDAESTKVYVFKYTLYSKNL